MGPKKKGIGGGSGGGGGKKRVAKKSSSAKRVNAIIDGVSVQDMSKEQLETHVKRLLDELGREREERHLFQVERDRLQAFYDLSQQQLEEQRALLRVKERQGEEVEQKHETQIKLYKQKVKHLLYEHETKLAELRAENTLSLKKAEEAHLAVEQLHLSDKRSLESQMLEQERATKLLLSNMKLEERRKVSEVRGELEHKVSVTQSQLSQQVVELRDELTLRLKTELSESEERKNEQIDELQQQSHKALTDMKNYYNDITVNNLAVISALKEEAKERQRTIERQEHLLNTLRTQNKKLVGPLKAAEDRLVDMQRQMAAQVKEKEALQNARARVRELSKVVDELRVERELYRQRSNHFSQERDELYEKFSRSVQELKQRSLMKSMEVEHKMQSMQQALHGDNQTEGSEVLGLDEGSSGVRSEASSIASTSVTSSSSETT